MDKPLTPKQLEEIKSREAAATKGPWRRKTHDLAAHEIQGENGLWILSTGNMADATFVARARTDILLLIAEIERLWAKEQNPPEISPENPLTSS